jgi:hypothetical protein
MRARCLHLPVSAVPTFNRHPTTSACATYSSSACRDVNSCAIAETRVAIGSPWRFEDRVETGKWRGARIGGHGVVGQNEGVYGDIEPKRLIQEPMAVGEVVRQAS